MKTVQTIYGVFDTDLGRLVGIAPQGVPDVTFIAGQDTQTDGLPVTVKSNPVTEGSEKSTLLVSGKDAFATLGVFPRTTQLRVATFGDSTADFGQISSVTNATDQSAINSIIPASGVTTLAIGLEKMQLPGHYPAAYIVGKGGISGETTTQMLARDAAAYSAARRAMHDVIAMSPHVVILRGGSINDIAGFTPATSQSTIDAVYDRHMRIVETFLSFGVNVLDEGFYGYDATSGVPPAAENLSFIRATLVQLNARYKAAIAQLPGARFLDTSGVTHDGTGAFLPGSTLSTDGTHLSASAQYRMAQAESVALTAWFGPSYQAYPGVNLLGSAALFHTPVATGGYGYAQAGYTWVASACTRQNANVGQRGGKRWAWCEGVPSGANPNLNMWLPLDIDGGAATMPVTAGRKYGIELDYFIETLDGSNLGTGAIATATLNIYNATNAGRISFSLTSTSVGTPNGNSLSGKLVIPPITMPESSANLGTSTEFYVNWKGAAAGNQSFRAGISAPRFVDITDSF